MIKKLMLAGLLMSLAPALYAGELLTNGGFEFGAVGWSLSTNVLINGALAHSGMNCLSIYSAGNQRLTNFMSITVPTNAEQFLLTFYYNVTRTDGTNSYDSQMWAQVANFTGAALATGPVISNTNVDNQWHKSQLDLTQYKDTTSGQLQIQFVVYSLSTNNGSTRFSLDDVSAFAVTAADRPANDDFAARTVLPRTNILSVGASNTYASWEPGETNHAARNAGGGSSVWWSYTPKTNGTMTIATTTSTFNTILAVYTGSSISNLSLIASNADLSSTMAGSRVQFKAQMGTEYEIVVDGTNGAQGLIALGLNLVTDTNVPTVAISYPGSGAIVTSPTIAARGTASDNFWVSNVVFRLENAKGTNAYQTATSTNGWTSWSATVSGLVPGANTLRVLAYDENGNVSVARTVKFTYALSDYLHLATTGLGKVTAGYSNALLQLGKSYRLTATPAIGNILSNWTDGAGMQLTNGLTLTFNMSSNLFLYANFVPNPFIPTKGSYAGLFLPTNAEDIAFTNSGYFSATVSDRGALSARLQVGGASYSLSGALSAGGQYSNSIVRRGSTPLVVQLQLDLKGGNVITGLVGAAPLWADRAVYAATNHTPLAGNKYTLAMQVSTNVNVASAPGDYSAGALSVDPLGNISFSGTLSDGTKVTQSAPLSPHNQWPLFLPLYSGKGSMLGWLNLSNQPGTMSVGQVSWLKPASTSKVYPAFNLNGELDAFLSRYTFTNHVPVLNLTNPIVVLAEGNLAVPLTNGFTLTTNNLVTATNKLSLRLTTATGLFQGTVPRVVNGKTTLISINGAVLQNQNAGWGSFLGTNQSGSATMQSQ